MSKYDITKYSDKDRILVAKSEKTMEDVLNVLSKDPKEIIRVHVVNNPSTQIETLLELLDNEKSIKVKTALALSNRLPYDKLVEKYINDNSVVVIRSLIINENCSLDAINKLYNHKDETVRAEVAKQSKTPKEIKEILQNDSHVIVRQSLPFGYKFDVDLKKIDDEYVSNPNNAKIVAKILAEFWQYDTKDIFFNKNLHKDVLLELVQKTKENINYNIDKPGYFRHLALYHPNADLDVYKTYIKYSHIPEVILSKIKDRNELLSNGFVREFIHPSLKKSYIKTLDYKIPEGLNEYLITLKDFNTNYYLVKYGENLNESVLNELEKYFIKELEIGNKELDSFKISQLLKENLFGLDSLEIIKKIAENNKNIKYNLDQINNKIDELQSLDIDI